jgi:hypothetical protein
MSMLMLAMACLESNAVAFATLDSRNKLHRHDSCQRAPRRACLERTSWVGCRSIETERTNGDLSGEPRPRPSTYLPDDRSVVAPWHGVRPTGRTTFTHADRSPCRHAQRRAHVVVGTSLRGAAVKKKPKAKPRSSVCSLAGDSRDFPGLIIDPT